MDHIRNPLLALSQITGSSSVRCQPRSLAPSGPAWSGSSWGGWTCAMALSYLVSSQIQHKTGKQRAFVHGL